MPLPINGYNETFKAFADFAAKSVDAGRSKAIARASGDASTGALAGRSISPAGSDSVRHVFNWFRASDEKTANDETRRIFREAVAGLFGGESRIPESVRKAMLESDYGKGKPLTARRIVAVRRAVDEALGRIGAAADAVKAAASGVYGVGRETRPETVDALIVSAVKAAGDDKDLIGLLRNKKTIKGVLVSGEGIRAEEDVLRKVAALKANVDELRAATKGNRAMFEAGLRGLANLGGKTFAKGCIAAMVREASAAKIDAIRSLSASSDAGAVHEAVVQYHTNATAILKASNALSSFKVRLAEETNGTRSFIGMLMLARCSPAKLRAMDAALKSESAAKASWLYDQVVNGNFEKDGYSAKVADEISFTARRIGFTLLDLSANVSEALGQEPVDVGEFKGRPDERMAEVASDVLTDLGDIAERDLADAAEARDAARAAANGAKGD